MVGGGLALSCTCSGPDAASWQQSLAERAWRQWEAEYHVLTRESALVINYHTDIPFLAPGPSAVYQYRDSRVEVEHPLPAIWALGVLDHIEAPVKFLARARQLLRPEGLLFLTFCFWDAEGPDVAVGAASRTRIYDRGSWTKLIAEARRLGLIGFGGHDWAYHGNTLDDHSLASLVLVKRSTNGGD